MSPSRHLVRAAYLTCAVGAVLQAGMCLRGLDPHDVGGIVFRVTLLLIGAGPYAFCFFLARRAERRPWAPLGALLGALPVLAIGLLTLDSVFLNPTSSTAGLAMLFAPILTYPASGIGVATGYFLGRRKTISTEPPTSG